MPRSPASETPTLGARQVAAQGGSAGRIALVHGFTQTSSCWDPIDVALAVDHDLVVIDAPGHGTSSDVDIDLPYGGRAVLDAGGQATYIGYSMGARLCLHAALADADRVERLVLVSGTAGIDDADERASRRASDERLADHIIDVGVPTFVDEWLALPLFAGLSPDARHHRARLTNTSAGLASSLRLAGTGTQAPLWDRLAELDMAVLVVAGAADAKFATLAERMAAAIGGNAELAIVPGAGHTVHLEQPEAFLAVLREWLTRTAP
jgi:2-succinyl-6-hydroxy-2,4-cyclohexadiene-1-carboxylate synthase